MSQIFLGAYLLGIYMRKLFIVYLNFKFDWVFFLRYHLFIFRERGREGEREGERRHCVVAFHIVVAARLEHPLLGTWPTTQACALTRNPTNNPLVCRLALSPLSDTSQGWASFILFAKSGNSTTNNNNRVITC